MKECPPGRACRNYRARPLTPTGDTVKTIPLTNGFYAYVDAADYEWLNRWHWRAYRIGYAARYEKGKMIYMHRQIMQPAPGMVVDHVNGNGYDNTRANMRNIARQQNAYNNGKHIVTASIYKGVSYIKRRHQWCARIHSGKGHLHLGYFDTEAEAARAYDRGAVGVFGEFARLNFPEEWPPQRRARVHAQWQKESRKTRGKKQVKSRIDPRGAAREKRRTGKRRRTTARR